MTEELSIPEDWLGIDELFFEDEDSPSVEESCTRKRKAGNDSKNLALNEQETGVLPKKKQKKTKRHKLIKKLSNKMIIRPNYFVGIRVSNPQVHKLVRNVQENIIMEHPSLHVSLIPIPTLHITLAVTHLAGIEEVQRASEAVKKCSDDFRKTLTKKPLCLSFTGLRTFGSQVLYIGVDQSEDSQAIKMLAINLDTVLKNCGFTSFNKEVFSPHLTILKMSRGWKSKKKSLSKIPKSIYANMGSAYFGNQFVKGIELLSMNKPKDSQGYYFCSHKEIFFDIMSLESEDHGECCKKPLLTIKRTAESRRGIHTSASHEKYSIGDMGKILACIGAFGVLAAFLIKYWRSH